VVTIGGKDYSVDGKQVRPQGKSFTCGRLTEKNSWREVVVIMLVIFKVFRDPGGSCSVKALEMLPAAFESLEDKPRSKSPDFLGTSAKLVLNIGTFWGKEANPAFCVLVITEVSPEIGKCIPGQFLLEELRMEVILLVPFPWITGVKILGFLENSLLP
jgi:hypothetical protein